MRWRSARSSWRYVSPGSSPSDGTALQRRLQQTAYKDPYGRWVLDRAYKEAGYFFDNIVVPEVGPRNPEELALLLRLFTHSVEQHEFANLDAPAETGAAAGDGVGYERQVAAKLVAAGYSVSYTPVSGDQGVDLVAEKSGRRVAIQCKNYTKPAGNEAVQQVYAGARYYEAGRAVVVAPNGFTVAARQLASTLGVDCLHQDELVGALQARSAPAG